MSTITPSEYTPISSLRYDVAVVGGGAAGLSAALVLCQARRRILVVDSGTPRNAPAVHMHGYLSRDRLQPATLLETGRDEVRRYGGEVITDTVACIEKGRSGNELRLKMASGRLVMARRLLVATGLRDELPNVSGLRERWGRDVLHCPYCHGWEVREQRLGVLADGSPESVKYTQIVRQWSKDVIAFVPPDTLTQQQRQELIARAVKVVEDVSTRIRVHEDRLVGVEIFSGEIIGRDAVFVPPRFVPHDGLLAGLGCAFLDGWVVKDATGRTSEPTTWVAGNVANPRAQVITAAGEGSTAAIAINADLVDDDVRAALAAVQQEAMA